MTHEGVWTEYGPTYSDGWSACERVGDIVRCRDCRWSNEAVPVEDWHIECRVHPMMVHYTPEDGFCHLGERRVEQ